MALLSEILKDGEGITDKELKEFSKCSFCGKEIKYGGCWSGDINIGVCTHCANSVADLLIDTIDDSESTGFMSIDDRRKFIINFLENRMIRKEAKKKSFKNFSKK